MFKSQLPGACVIGEPVHVFPELGDGVEGLFILKREMTDLVADEAGDHLELHGSVTCQIHVLKEVTVCRAIQPGKSWERECVGKICK